MLDEFTETIPKVVIEYKNRKPLDLLDVTSALAAFGEEFRRYAAKELPKGSNARLQIGRLQSGSIIAQLIPMLEAADWLRQHNDLAAPFVANFGDIMSAIRSFPPSARAIEKSSARAAKSVVGPVAKDPGAEITIYAQTGANITTNIYNFGSNGSKVLRKHADLIIGGMAGEHTFEAEPMVLHQLRDGPAVSSGDYGFIDRFSTEPIKIRWGSEEVKSAVLDRPENVFDLIYFVTGTAQTAGGNVAVYNIRRLDDVALKPARDRHG